MISHVNNNILGEKFQSAYKTHHSTETALLKVKSDILQSLDQNNAVLLVLLDMSAAFDTVDHQILVDRLERLFGISGTAKAWFTLYLDNRRTRVSVRRAQSVEHVLKFSVPQGSVIGPQCFIMYTHPVGDIIRGHNINFHVYADDTQLYVEFDPKVPGDCERALASLSTCIMEINAWMMRNRLQMNQDKTEFCIIASTRNLNAIPALQLKIGDIAIDPSTTVRNLGVLFDSKLSMTSHINSICKSVNFHIRNLWRIRRFLTQESCLHAVRALILSRIDYANSLLYGAREVDLQRLQRLQNKAARLVFACGRENSSVQLLRSLHWLTMRERIKFKILLYVYKSIHGEAPSYLSEHLNLYNTGRPEGGRRLRSSSDVTRLVVPRSTRKVGDNSCIVVAPKLWNQLPCEIREAASTPVFKRLLKTFLFPD